MSADTAGRSSQGTGDPQPPGRRESCEIVATPGGVWEPATPSPDSSRLGHWGHFRGLPPLSQTRLCECNDDTYTSRVPFSFFLSGFKVKHVLGPLKVSRAPGPRPAGPNGGASPAGRLFKSPRGPEPRVTQLSGHIENRLRWHHRVSGQGRPVRGVQRGRQDLPRGEGRLQPLAGHR